jgi:hypothetical protein
MIGKLYQNKKYSRNFQYIEYGIKNLLEMFGEKRTQKLSPGLIKDQHGLFYFFSRSLFSTTVTSILIKYGGRMQISKMGLILPYECFSPSKTKQN